MKNEITGYASIDKPYENGMNFLKKHPFIPNLNICDTISLTSIFYKQSNALDCLNLKLNYQELLKYSKILSKSFMELGLKKGDILACAMPNFFQAVAVFLAANKIGVITTFLNSSSSIDEIIHYLNVFESPIFINFAKDIEYNKKIKNNTKVKNIITLSRNDLNIKSFNSSNNKLIGYNDIISFSDMNLIAKFYKYKLNYTGKHDDALILFTSGSTGNPKSVVLTNENLLSSGIYMKNSTNTKISVGEKCLVCVPFSYPYGFATSVLMSLLCGREAILAPNLSSENINYFINKEPNIIFGSPALLELIKRNVTKENLSFIKTFISGGDFLNFNQYVDGLNYFNSHDSNIEICNGSGNAETTATSTTAVGVPSRPDTVGKVLVGSQAIIIDPDTLKELKYGEEGLLCISGKHVFKEYYNEPKLTSDSKFYYKGKEYFKTGTRGFLDDKGYFTLTGRDSRYYIMSSLNKIYCDHVQNIISSINIVDSCAVVKMPDADNLYVGKAFIVLKKDIKPSNDILNYIKKKCLTVLKSQSTGEEFQLKPYEIPAKFEFIDKLPRSISDKIDYKLLEENAEKDYNDNNSKRLKLIR